MKKQVIILFLFLYFAAGVLSFLSLKKAELSPTVSGAASGLLSPAFTLSPEDFMEPEETQSAPSPEYIFTASHSSGRLFIRKGPSTKEPVLSFLTPGETGKVLKTGNGWALVTSGEKTGYVSMNYLKIEEK